MRKLFFTLALLLAGSFAFSSNITSLMFDCYDDAFDAMEIVDDLGGTAEEVAFWGEMAYCECADNCETGY